MGEASGTEAGELPEQGDRGRRRPNLTGQEIWSAADQLLSRGERVSIESVRLELKGGAPYTIQMALRTWWQNLPRRLKDRGPEPAAAQAFEVFWKTARAEALAQVREEEERREAQRAESLAQATKTLDVLRRELEQANSARTQLEQERDAALGQVAEADRRTAVLRLQLDNAKGLLELERRRHPNREPVPGAVIEQLSQLQAQCTTLIAALSSRSPPSDAASGD